jgi:TDG/mug DNA glycosylase family protein
MAMHSDNTNGTEDEPDVTPFRNRLANFSFTPTPQTLRRSPRKSSSASKNDRSSNTDKLARHIKSEPTSPTRTPKRRRSQKVNGDLNDNDAEPKSPEKKLKLKRGYAPPEKYAHLNLLPDHLGVGLDGKSNYRGVKELLIDAWAQ